MNKKTLVLFFTIFIDLLGFGILIPVIPILLADPRSPEFLLPAGMTISQGFILLGFLTAVFPFFQFLAAPILGQLSDRYGRKPILAISLAGTCLSYVLFAIGIITKNIPLLFIARSFDGITGGNFVVAQAAIADVTTPENRVKTFGLFGAVFGLGFILGPYIGGKLSDPSVISWFNSATPFWFAAILSLCNVLSVLFVFQETNRHINQGKPLKWAKSVQNIVHAYTAKPLRIIFATNFLSQAGFTFFTTFASIFFITRLGFTQGNIGDYFAFIGLCSVLAQGLVVRPLSNKVKPRSVLRVAIVMQGVMLLIFTLVQAPWQLYLITPLFSMFTGMMQANSNGLISNSVAQNIQGEVLGINGSVTALAQSIPPVLSGYIAASLTATTPLVIAGIVIICAGLLFIAAYRPGPLVENIA